MNSKIPETISISGGAVSSLIKLGDGDAALLYLYITAGEPSTLPWSAERRLAAQDKLKALGLTPAAPKHAAEPAKPTTKAINEMQSEKKFYTLAQELQRLFGRILSSDELVRLFGIYDSLGMPTEVILQLVVYCVAETQGRGMPSMKYIEKVAYTWEREGIKTLEHAEAYIKERTEKKQASAKIKALLQIYDRNFTSTERKYVDGWLALGYDTEAIAIAYDRTVTKTGKLSWGYMNSIINSWHSKSLYKADDILAKDTRQNTVTRAGGTGAVPDESEVLRINRILSSLNKEN